MKIDRNFNGYYNKISYFMLKMIPDIRMQY